MLQSLALRQIDAQEQKLGASLDYLRHMARTSLRLLWRFGKIFPFAMCRKALPVDAMHVAALTASHHEDCGGCVQIAVNVALADNLSREIIQAVLDTNPQLLTDDLSDVYHFTHAVVTRTGAEEPLRERLVRRYGDEALIELAMIIAAARVFPTVKRAMGYATSCSRVKVTV
jgi:alkylhydroperoxidase family enzyme